MKNRKNKLQKMKKKSIKSEKKITTCIIILALKQTFLEKNISRNCEIEN